MRLKRNITPDGMCKYSLIEHEKNEHVEHGFPWTENEFFVLKLKDKYAKAALEAYADAICRDPDNYDEEYATDIEELIMRAGTNSKWCKKPD